jgi:hypothetical protein
VQVWTKSGYLSEHGDFFWSTCISVTNIYECFQYGFAADSSRIHRRFTADISSTADSPQIHRRYFFNRGFTADISNRAYQAHFCRRFTADSPQIFLQPQIHRRFTADISSTADSPQIHRGYFQSTDSWHIFEMQFITYIYDADSPQIHRRFTADIFSTADSPQIHRRFTADIHIVSSTRVHAAILFVINQNGYFCPSIHIY